MWTLKAFIIRGNVTVVFEWFQGQTDAVQTAFETRLRFLREQPPVVWQRPYVGTLTRDCDGLFEIRLKAENVQHRAIGYYSDELEFTILAFATERDRQFVPLTTCETAQARRRSIEEGRGQAREFTFEEEPSPEADSE